MGCLQRYDILFQVVEWVGVLVCDLGQRQGSACEARAADAAMQTAEPQTPFPGSKAIGTAAWALSLLATSPASSLAQRRLATWGHEAQTCAELHLLRQQRLNRLQASHVAVLVLCYGCALPFPALESFQRLQRKLAPPASLPGNVCCLAESPVAHPSTPQTHSPRCQSHW